MRTTAHVSVSRDVLGTSTLNELSEIYPQGIVDPGSSEFHAVLSADDPRIQKILRVLTKSGLATRSGAKEMKRGVRGNFQYSLHRAYSEDELDSFELLEFRAPPSSYHWCERAESGELFLPHHEVASEAWDSADFFSGYLQDSWVITPERVKASLEARQLHHLLFRPVEYWPPGSELERWEDVLARIGRPYWELDTDVILPPVSPAMKLHDEQRRLVVDGEPRVRITRRDGDFAQSELRYRKGDLQRTPKFDIARTYENFGGSPSNVFRQDLSALIVSQRFRQACMEEDFKAEFVPVHVDAD